jgi:[acyl-carrier-protein] S-malonyltransferase
MGKSFYDEVPSVKRLFEEASDVTGKDLRTLCFDGPDTTLVQTDNVQPAITLVSLVALQVLRDSGVDAAAAAGHSVGEYAALCAAGTFSFADAMQLVQVRGAAMRAEAERHPGSMAAIFGLSPEVLAEICADAGAGGVQLANHNTKTQIVVTGTQDGVQAVGKAAKARGAKLVVPLKVSGPWHSRFMAGAQEPLRECLQHCTVSAPKIETIANVTATAYGSDPDSIKSALVTQIVSPVLWSQSMAGLVARGFRTFVEVGPGRVLGGLLKDFGPEIRVFNVQDTETLSKFLAAATAN